MKKFYYTTILPVVLLLCGINSYAQIDAVDDVAIAPINGAFGGQAVANVLINDTLNGVPVNFSTINLSMIGTNNPGVTLNPTNGTVTVAIGTPAGTYSIWYQICEIAVPTNCDFATITISVTASVIDAVNDVYTINGYNGVTQYGSVLQNDQFNGAPTLASMVNIYSIFEATPLALNLPVPILNVNNGSITVLPGTPIGSYTIVYNICEKLNPTNCDTATITINVVDNNSLFDGIGVFLTSVNRPVAGSLYSNKLSIINYGTQSIPNGIVIFTKDNNLSVNNIIPSTGVTTTSTGFTYNYTNLLPGENRTIVIDMSVPSIPMVAIGQQLTSSATVTPTDSFPNDNTSSVTDTIVASHDPNDKTENHGGQIVHSTFTSQDYLTYTIRFENTGTAAATNIRIEDILDTKLDETSLRMITASTSYILTRTNNTISWLFNNINLPPSVPDTQTGHGNITFQVKPKPGFAVGDIIPNTAAIYFDTNPAIMTNTCTTEFVNALNTNNFAFDNFKYYPNPVKNSLNISNGSTIDAVEITSILGQKVLIRKVNDLQTDINLAPLSAGIYFIKVSSSGQEKTVKVIKE